MKRICFLVDSIFSYGGVQRVTTVIAKELAKLYDVTIITFDNPNANAVHLNVFPENIRAKKFYEKIGFKERKTDENAFSFKDEAWGRCNMVISKKF